MNAFKQRLFGALAVAVLGLGGCDKSASNDEKTNKSGPGTPAQPNDQKNADPHSPEQPGPAVAPQGNAPSSTPTAAEAPRTNGNTGGEAAKSSQ